jgi:hypothetical protein
MDMLEKMAREMCRADGWNPDVLVQPYAPVAYGARGHPHTVPGVPSWTLYEFMAAAGLSAIRDVSPEVELAWKKYDPHLHHGTSPPTLTYPLGSNPGAHWQTAIDTILNGRGH